MTVTFLAAPGMRPSRRRWTRRLAATGAAALVALTAVLPGISMPAAVAATETAAMARTGVVTASLAPAGAGVVRPGEALSVTVSIANGTSGSTGPAHVSLAIGDAPLSERSDLTAWLAGDTDGVPVTEAATVELDAVAPGVTGSSPLTVPPDHPSRAERGPGVYPIVAVVAGGGWNAAATSVIVVPAEGAAPAPLGVVVPVTAPPLTRGLLTADELDELTGADGELTAQLNAVEGTGAILAVDPAIPAAIRVLGAAAPASATAWLGRLETLPNPRFALQFGDADIAAQLSAGLGAPLEPTSLHTYMAAENFAATRPSPTPGATAGTPTPTVTRTPGAPELPELAELVDVGAIGPTVYWPVTGTAGPETVSALGALSTPEDPATILVPSASTNAGAAGSTVPARADADAARLLVYDSEISAALARAASEPGTVRRAPALAAATAHLTLALADAAGRPLLVTVDRGQERSAPALRAAMTAASGVPGSAPATLADLVDAAGEAVAIEPAETGAERAADTAVLLQDEASLTRFAAILDDPALLTGRERAELLQLLGAAWRSDPEAAAEAVAAHREQTNDTLDAVGILPSTVNRLISFDAALLPWVRNDLPWPVNLELTAQPDDARLVVEHRTSVRALAGSNTRTEVPVQARIANGDVTVALQLYSPAGEPIGSAQSIEVEVRAEWESIGLVALVILLVLFIGTGVVRMVLRRRADRRAPAGESGP